MTITLVISNFIFQGVHLYHSSKIGYFLLQNNKLVMMCPGGILFWTRNIGFPYAHGYISPDGTCSCPCRHALRIYPHNTHVQDMFYTCTCCQRHDDATVYLGPESDLDMHDHRLSKKRSKKLQSGSSSRQGGKKRMKKRTKKRTKKPKLKMQDLQEYYN